MWKYCWNHSLLSLVMTSMATRYKHFVVKFVDRLRSDSVPAIWYDFENELLLRCIGVEWKVEERFRSGPENWGRGKRLKCTRKWEVGTSFRNGPERGRGQSSGVDGKVCEWGRGLSKLTVGFKAYLLAHFFATIIKDTPFSKFMPKKTGGGQKHYHRLRTRTLNN